MPDVLDPVELDLVDALGDDPAADDQPLLGELIFGGHVLEPASRRAGERDQRQDQPVHAVAHQGQDETIPARTAGSCPSRRACPSASRASRAGTCRAWLCRHDRLPAYAGRLALGAEGKPPCSRAPGRDSAPPPAGVSARDARSRRHVDIECSDRPHFCTAIEADTASGDAPPSSKSDVDRHRRPSVHAPAGRIACRLPCISLSCSSIRSDLRAETTDKRVGVSLAARGRNSRRAGSAGHRRAAGRTRVGRRRLDRPGSQAASSAQQAARSADRCFVMDRTPFVTSRASCRNEIGHLYRPGNDLAPLPERAAGCMRAF